MGIPCGGEMMRMRGVFMTRILYSVLTIVCFCLAACGPGNNVRLLPPPPIEAAALPAPNAPSVSVVCFTDKRLNPEVVGKRRDGSAFTTNGDVSQWLSRALADELARQGLRVTFAMDTAQARSGNPDYLITGEVDQVWLSEASAVELGAQLRVQCTLANRKGKLWTETTNTSQTTGGLMAGGAADQLLQKTMADLIQPIVKKVMTSVAAKK